MVSLKLCFGAFWVLHCILVLSVQASNGTHYHSLPDRRTDEEDNILQGFNTFRQSANVPPLTKNEKAKCFADEVADTLDNQVCTSTSNTQSPVSDYTETLTACKIDVNTVRDGIMLSVCVPRRDADLVLTNFTQSRHAAILNDSRYTGVGIGEEDGWVIVVLSTNTHGGSFSNVDCFLSRIGMAHYLVPSVLSLFLVFAL